jgi:hypothetical protein
MFVTVNAGTEDKGKTENLKYRRHAVRLFALFR